MVPSSHQGPNHTWGPWEGFRVRGNEESPGDAGRGAFTSQEIQATKCLSGLTGRGSDLKTPFKEGEGGSWEFLRASLSPDSLPWARGSLSSLVPHHHPSLPLLWIHRTPRLWDGAECLGGWWQGQEKLHLLQAWAAPGAGNCAWIRLYLTLNPSNSLWCCSSRRHSRVHKDSDTN